MIYEMRVYTLRPGKVREFEALFESEALPAIQKYSKLIGWWSTEIGPLNEVVHIWAYDDLDHRERKRSAQGADPQVQAFRAKVQPMFVAQCNKIMTPAGFSPLK